MKKPWKNLPAVSRKIRYVCPVKQPLLLLHGAISSGKQFDVLLPLLEEQFDLHIHDFPGHGGKTIPETFSVPLFTESVIKYMDKNKLDKVSIFGYSMGGYIGLHAAAYHPSRIDKVFTLATKFDWITNVAAKEAAQLDPEKILEKVPAFAAILDVIHYPQDWKKVLRKTATMLLELGKAPALTEKELSRINIPVAIGIGDLDMMVSIEESRNAAKHLSNGRLLQLSSTPHPFEKVSHRMLAEHIIDFFESE